MEDMQIKVKFRQCRGDGSVRGICSAELGGKFAVRNIRVMYGKNGLFVSMPSQKLGDKYVDVCFPCTTEFKRTFDQTVLDAYQRRLKAGDEAEEQ